MNYQKPVFIILLILLLFYCRIFSQDDSNSILEDYDFDHENTTVIKLPQSLKEISGLALFSRTELLAHNDEEGTIYKFDITSGEVTGKIKIGDEKVEKDFEGIAIVKDSAYLVTSNGTIYKFSMLLENKAVEFVKFKTFLGIENDIEGLCYDETTNSLLLACKNDPGKGFKKVRAVYSFNMNKMTLERTPKFLISLEELKEKFGIKDFAPSGIEKNPVNGNFFIISANPEAIIELSPGGNILAALKLDNKMNKQPEGITFLEDGSLILSDEGQKKSARISIVKLKEKK